MFVVAVGLVGCGATSPSVPAGGPPPTTLPVRLPTIDERFTPDIPAELRVREPKDVRGIDPCDLLSRDQIGSFGLDPDSARANPARYGAGCLWQYRDGSTSAEIGTATEPNGFKLPDAYRLRENSANFEILQIAGHPAVRDDIAANGQCELGLAVADDQIVTISAYADGRILPDPCAPARRMAELIIANLAARP